MSYKFITCKKVDRISYVTINRPECLNALHPPANYELYQAFCDFRDDPESWVAILTGTGNRAFSSGNDLRHAAKHWKERESPGPHIPFGGITSGFDCWKPIIAAVNGYALGGGFELALACDIIISSDNAEMGLPEPKVGLIAAAGGVHRLPRTIPLKLAMGMMLTGRRISANEAQHLGIVNEVTPLATLMSTAQRWAAEILELAPMSIRATKQMAIQGLDWPLDIALNRKYTEQQKFEASKDRIEGPLAFSEKRKPIWTGHLAQEKGSND